MPMMFYFFLATAALILGYVVYGAWIERLFGPDDRATPVQRMADGVDYVVLKPSKIFLIQLLNIAGLGPVFGPIVGALYGPAALFWVVLGSIFAGAVHDYFSGMISLRYDGKSLPDWVGYNIGMPFRSLIRYGGIVLLVLVGVVFVAGPAGLLAHLTHMDKMYFVVIIFAYYFCATVLPIDKIIGKIYPLFAVLLVIMAVGLIAAMFLQGYEMHPVPENMFSLANGQTLWPMMFITIACGAISGFHATQSPMMARCMTSERHGRPIFYGAMIAEGFIGLIWVTIGMTFYQGTDGGLTAALGGINVLNPVLVVNDVSIQLLGTVGGALAILGVVVLPVSTGDTSFRAARLIAADALNYNQGPPLNRLILAVPMFVVGVILNFVPFGLLWQYFAWANQSLSVVTLWAIAAYLWHHNKTHWVATVPAIFMTVTCTTFICVAKIGFGTSLSTATYIGCAVGAITFVIFLLKGRRPLAEDPLFSDFHHGERVLP